MNFITPEQVAELLKVDTETILLLLKQKKLPGVKIGTVWRVEEERLCEFLANAMNVRDSNSNQYEEYDACQIPIKGKRGRKPTGKYDGLKRFLKQTKGEQIKMSFSEIEGTMKGKLPQSAYNLRPWWANDFSHSQARAWLHAGWETRNLDLANRCVTFVRRG